MGDRDRKHWYILAWLWVGVVAVNGFAGDTRPRKNVTYAQPRSSILGKAAGEIRDIISLSELQYVFNYSGSTIPSEIFQMSTLTSLLLENDVITGTIPSTLGNITTLMELNVHSSQVRGSLPSEMGKLVNLKVLELRRNLMTGTIPTEFGLLNSLTFLSLSENTLNGSIPESITGLAGLRELFLEGNELTGPIPPSVGNMQNLYNLYLQDNHLTSMIPTTMGGMKWLVNLDLQGNNLTGPIPPQLGSDMAYLYQVNLARNMLTGTLPLELGEVASLEGLVLAQNRFSGSIPKEWGQQLTRLRVLDVSYNNLHGNMTSSILPLTSLSDLSLRGNQFTGELPASLGALTGLYRLDLGENTINGTIPINAIKQLIRLRELALDGNHLQGPVPSDLQSLTRLTGLLLGHNRLTGFLPTELGNLRELAHVDLAGNELLGNLPDGFSALGRLKTLHLESNRLSGTFPEELLRNSRSLEEFYLDHNAFRGTIPSELGTLTGLYGVGLESNQFSGSIPTELGSLLFLKKLSLNNNKLVGEIPLHVMLMHQLTHLTLHENQLSGTVPDLIKMTNLRSLNLGRNQLEGDLDALFFNATFPDLEVLDLHQNQFKGTLTQFSSSSSSMMSSFPNLKYFDLEQNEVSGPLPGNLSNNLEVLKLGNNKLTNMLPTQLQGLSELSILSLHDNKFSGTLSEDLFSELLELRMIDLGGNILSGTIPNGTDFQALTSLTSLRLDRNLFQGQVPWNFGKLVNLQELWLGWNQLMGPIPESLVQLTELTDLSMNNNALTGEVIPQEMAISMTNLRKLHLSQNNLEGSIPSELEQLGSLEQLLIDNNLGVHGTLPKSLLNWTNLLALNIANTSVENTHCILPMMDRIREEEMSDDLPLTWNGQFNTIHWDHWFNRYGNTIPESIDRLSSMTTLNLTASQVLGTIPSDAIAKLKFMEVVDLGANSLSGPVPDVLGSLKILRHLDLSGNKLTGSIPSSFGTFVDLEKLYLQGNFLEGSVPKSFSFFLTASAKLQQVNLTGNALTGNPSFPGSAPRDSRQDGMEETRVWIHWSRPVFLFSWNQDDVMYDIMVNGTIMNETNQESVIIEDLAPNSTYEVAIRAREGKSRIGGWAESFEVVTDPGCPLGTERIDPKTCRQCQYGFYRSKRTQGQCHPCPDLFPETLDHLNCITAKGWFSFWNNDTQMVDAFECIESKVISEGANCDFVGLTLETLPIKPGYWRISNTSFDIRPCPNPEFCAQTVYTSTIFVQEFEDQVANLRVVGEGAKRMPRLVEQGMTIAVDKENGNICVDHHEGILCQSCVEGYALKNDQCVECTDEETARDAELLNVAVFVIIAIVISPSVFILIRWRTKTKLLKRVGATVQPVSLANNKERDDGVPKEEEEETKATKKMKVVAARNFKRAVKLQVNMNKVMSQIVHHEDFEVYLRILVGFLQVWVPFVISMAFLQRTNAYIMLLIVQLNPGALWEAMGIGCVMKLGLQSMLIMYAVLPLSIIALMITVMLLSVLVKRKRRVEGVGEQGEQGVGSSIVSSSPSQPHFEGVLDEIRGLYQWTILHVFFLVYPGVSGLLLQPFFYDTMPAFKNDPNPYKALTVDPTVDFRSGYGWRWRVISGIMIGVFPFVIGYILWFTIRHAAYGDDYDSEGGRLVENLKHPLAFLWRSYHPEFKWFESYEFMRKFWLISAAYQSRSLTGQLVFIGLSALGWYALVVFRPYRVKRQQIFAEISLALLNVSGLVAYLFSTHGDMVTLPQAKTIMVGILLLEIGMFVILVSISMYYYQINKNKE